MSLVMQLSRLTANPAVSASLAANLVVRGEHAGGVVWPYRLGRTGPSRTSRCRAWMPWAGVGGVLCWTVRRSGSRTWFRYGRFGGRRVRPPFPGLVWSATTGQHVGFESWLERDRLVLMDFDPAVVQIASQPFWLHWHDGSRERRHAPDFFVRRADGSAVVVDVRADDWIVPRDAEAFEVTRRACAEAGRGFERVGMPEAVLLANVRWLSRYRHPRCRQGPVAARLMEVAHGPPRCPLIRRRAGTG
ncbi:TnsA-like heteromeric transposase endonuclease subunit [Streptomyces tanashiensis]|uniref:TnsA-like heteromeric transposase endonuclease subunit n=1 Tax=Streptomyces tanashiensis TaxID=67367 RepID=UPI003433BC98